MARARRRRGCGGLFKKAIIDRWPQLLTHENPRVATYLYTFCAVALAFAMLIFFRPEVGHRNFVYFQF